MLPSRARRKFPQLNNDEIKYCSIFYEGMHDDARTNLAIALTSAKYGASILNYGQVVELLHDSNGKAAGAVICDKLTGEKFKVHAKSVILCGGPFTDSLRQLEQNGEHNFKPAVTGASGIHIGELCAYR